MAVKKSYLDKIFWTNKKVLITGVTGFKGSWMSLIMSNYKAKVYGLGLMTSNQNDLFNSLKLKIKFTSIIAISTIHLNLRK